MLSCEGADIWRRLHISSSVIHKASTYGQHQRPSCYVYRSKATVCRRLPGVKRPPVDEPPGIQAGVGRVAALRSRQHGAWIARGGRRFVMGAYPVKATCESFDCWFRLRRYGRRCADLPVIEKAAACFTRGFNPASEEDTDECASYRRKGRPLFRRLRPYERKSEGAGERNELPPISWTEK